MGIYQRKLRFFTSEVALVPTREEAAESELQQKELAQQRAKKLSAKLRELNIDPDDM